MKPSRRPWCDSEDARGGVDRYDRYGEQSQAEANATEVFLSEAHANNCHLGRTRSPREGHQLGPSRMSCVQEGHPNRYQLGMVNDRRAAARDLAIPYTLDCPQ